MKSQERFYKFSKYLRERFGCTVYKVSIDAGFSCPNKDGKFSKDGCIYCDNRAFSFNARSVKSNQPKADISLMARTSNGTRISPRPIEIQIKEGMSFARKRYGAKKFIIYFQAYTNTYATLKDLKERYDVVRKFEDVVGIAIGTRPDCINEEILDLIEGYSSDYEIWLEYGLQSIHKKTLEFINRNHLYEDFLRAVGLTRKRNIKICAHIIIGLPGENEDEIIETAKEMGHLKLDGIKIHPLHIIKRTRLEELSRQGLYKPVELNEFVSTATKFLKYLWPNTIIQRITADCPQEFLLGPLWILDKSLVLSKIEEKLIEKDIFQGDSYLARNLS